MREGLLLLLLLLALPATAGPITLDTPAHAQPTRVGFEADLEPPRRVEAVRRTAALSIDGNLMDADWERAPVFTSLTQLDPHEGQPASERTEVRMVFDDEALYVSARLYDSAPDSIIARLGRRDANLESDHFMFFVDPYYDRRSGYYFGVNAAGTLYDGVLMNDEWDDESWDGVWEGKAMIDEQGWSVEMRIPYSQLRFYERDQYVWGINVRRGIARKNERSFLVHVPRKESGFVSQFADLVGIEAIKPRRQIEVLPYTTMQAAFTEAQERDPFNDGSQYTPGLGADLRVGLTSNLTLNATVNPDFGQVEVDPAVVNLSDVETFFPEKRPFFIEGASVFNFGRGGANNNWGFNWGDPNFFYSRRVGRAPQGSLPRADFSDVNDGTRILGATKLAGRLGEGWNVGTIQSLTGREWATLQLGNEQFRAEAEPRAYYGVFRAQKEFKAGHHALGFISTVTKRDYAENRLRDEINSDAYTFGVDGWTFLDPDKTWVVTGWLGYTQVQGTQERMLRLQQSALHYFQRPDFKAAEVDSNATSLSGLAGRFMLNKQRGDFTVNAAVGFITPGFDVNDAGFMWQTNVINGHVAASYRFNTPTRWYRRYNINVAAFRSLDFDGNTTWTGLWTGHFVQFPNFSSIFTNFAYNPQTVSNRRTRGGPLMVNPWGWQLGGFFNTNSRKDWVFGINAFTYQQEKEGNLNTGVEVEWKPATNISLRLSPSVNLNREFAQWVGAFDDPHARATYGRRYVFASLDQVTFSSSIRLNWTFTPAMSLQLYAQPLVSSGAFEEHKTLRRANSYDFLTFGEEGSTFDHELMIADPDGEGPAKEIRLPDQDFNFKSLRGTAVLRWEYRPGSTLYLVWTQSRSDFLNDGRFNFGPSLGQLFDAKPDNIFMVKLNYWLSR